jgi:hypothetical protein
MGCGCKNKNNGAQSKPAVNQVPQTSTNQTSPPKGNPAIQDSIKKIVERYYKRK